MYQWQVSRKLFLKHSWKESSLIFLYSSSLQLLMELSYLKYLGNIVFCDLVPQTTSHQLCQHKYCNFLFSFILLLNICLLSTHYVLSTIVGIVKSMTNEKLMVNGSWAHGTSALGRTNKQKRSQQNRQNNNDLHFVNNQWDQTF